MTQVTIQSQDGKSFGAYFVAAADANAPGIVLIQEIFGVNAAMKAAAQEWAALGFNVVVPDLFWRQEANLELDPTVQAEFEKGVQLMQGADENVTVSDLEATRAWLETKIGNNRIAGLGYCWGGRLVVRMAVDTGVKCAVSYYGVGLEQLVPATPEAAVPTLLHIAELDSYVPEPVRNTILANVKTRPAWEAYVYEGCDHAFARPNGQHRDENATALAQTRSLEFMKKHL